MPKCDKCQYLEKDGYEYPEYYCGIFGYDIPEKYQTKYEWGCKCTQKHLKNLYEKKLEEEQKYWEEFGEWDL